MKRDNSSIDGFVPRRSSSQVGGLHTQSKKTATKPVSRSLHTASAPRRQTIGRPAAAAAAPAIGRSDITDSLRGIDTIDFDNEKKNGARRKNRKNDKLKKPKSKVKRIIMWVLIGIAVLGLGLVGFVVYRALSAGGNILQGNIIELIQNEPLQQDENGRSNFVVFGTAEDDEGGTHGGANLTDSIMVISIDQNKKDAYMVSLPRDLWVDYEETCTVGNQGKINAVYFCASNDGEDEAAGAAALQAKAGEILGLDIQYYVHLNFTAVVDAVDAVGGVDLTIPDYDPGTPGILDRNFDWKCNYQCYYVNYEDGERVHLDGEHALALARARNAQGGYGLPGGNFNREQNQQLIITALREKAVSAGTLTNLGAVTGLIDALGNNLRTNVQTREFRTMMSLGMDIGTDKIQSLSLVDEAEPLVTTGSYNGQSIVRPILGIMDYSDIQRYIQKNINATPVSREAASVIILNGGRAAGTAQVEADELTTRGLVVETIDNAEDDITRSAQIYQLNTDNPETAAYLAKRYGVAVSTGAPPYNVTGETDFVIILGPQGSQQ